MFLEAGQAVWPIPSTFYNGHAFPFKPKIPTKPTHITFVAVAPSPSSMHQSNMAMSIVTAAFLSALLSHPDAGLVLLHAPGTSPKVRIPRLVCAARGDRQSIEGVGGCGEGQQPLLVSNSAAWRPRDVNRANMHR